jgi:DNA primase RepB-like protein
MVASITQREVRQQLAAMACDRFDLGALGQNGRMMLSQDCGLTLIPSAIKWLRQQNARGAHIFIRPHSAHSLSLIDDLNAGTIVKMKAVGFEPALIVETSPRNYQVWLNHGRVLEHQTSTFAAKELVKRFGGDPSSADCRHFGRLAGFTNQKLERRLADGLQPFVRLREASGLIYSAAPEFLDQIIHALRLAIDSRPAEQSPTSSIAEAPIKLLSEFHNNPRYAGDLHRADMAWALHAASRGIPEQHIRNEILRGRDLSKKGRPARQLDYAERTAVKAFERLQHRP